MVIFRKIPGTRNTRDYYHQNARDISHQISNYFILRYLETGKRVSE